MKLPIATMTVEPSREDIRRGIEDSAALVRLARRFDLRIGKRGGLVGKAARRSVRSVASCPTAHDCGRGSEAVSHQEEPMTTALATTNNTSAALAFEPSDVASAYKLAQILVASRLLPRSLSTPEAAFTVIMAGRELGLTAMQSLRSLHVIEGKPVMSADLMMALCLRSSACDHFKLVESTDTKATFEAKRKGQDAVRLSFTMDQAKAAGLGGKDNWKKFPAAMLRARCVAALARVVFADLMLGIYDTDEIGPREQNIPTHANVEVVPESYEALPQANDEAADDGKPNPVDAAILEFGKAETLETLSRVRSDFAALKLRIDEGTKAVLREAYDAAKARIEAAGDEAA